MQTAAELDEFFANAVDLPGDDDVSQQNVDALPPTKRKRIQKWVDDLTTDQGRRDGLRVAIEKVREKRDDKKRELGHLQLQLRHGYSRSDATDAQEEALTVGIARDGMEIDRLHALKDRGIHNPLHWILDRLKTVKGALVEADVQVEIPSHSTAEEAFAALKEAIDSKEKERDRIEGMSPSLVELEAFALADVRRHIREPNITPLFHLEDGAFGRPPRPGQIIWQTAYPPVVTSDYVAQFFWAAQEIVEAKILNMVRALFDPENAITLDGRARKLAAVEAEILALDYQAGAIGAVVEAQGGTVRYRHGADPLTIIGLVEVIA